jgi:hypothetical protein
MNHHKPIGVKFVIEIMDGWEIRSYARIFSHVAPACLAPHIEKCAGWSPRAFYIVRGCQCFACLGGRIEEWWGAWMSSCRGEQVIMDEWREDWGMDDGARTLSTKAWALCIKLIYCMATSSSPCTHNKCSSLPCLMDRSACQSTQESDSQGQEQGS